MNEPLPFATKAIVGVRPGPHLLMVGGVHGDEFEPMAALRLLAAHLDPQRLAGRVTLAPVVNVAAFQRGDRVAEDGLDLARSFPGRKDGSTTERTAFALAELIRSADFFIDLHTGGTKLSVLPMTGYFLHCDLRVLDLQRRMAEAFNLPVVWGTDPELPGRTLSAARDAGVPAIYAEYLGGASCSESGVEAYFEGCLNVMRMLGMIDRAAAPRRVANVVEDARPGAGHLQASYPAPMAGYFEPAVRLGQMVAEGELLGWLDDALGEACLEILSAERGVVLVLRTFPAVQAGDALAVILATEPNHD